MDISEKLPTIFYVLLDQLYHRLRRALEQELTMAIFLRLSVSLIKRLIMDLKVH